MLQINNAGALGADNKAEQGIASLEQFDYIMRLNLRSLVYSFYFE